MLEKNSAREYGFDEDFLQANPRSSRHPENSKTTHPEEQTDDFITDSAIKWMQKNKEKSFFLNYWPRSVSAPYHAKPELIEKYNALANFNNKQYRPIYAAMIEAMDANIGKLLDALDQLDIADKTAIIFFSTNGGVTSDTEKCDGAAPTSNSPLRGGASSVYEGGLAVPCIVSWPNVTKFNSRSHAVIQGADFYPTFVSLLGLETKPGQIFDGVSIVRALTGKPLERQAVFTHFPHYPRLLSSGDPDALPPCSQVIAGEWKLIRIYHEEGEGKHGYRLHNLRDDVTETHNFSAENPGKVAELDALIQQHLDNTKAVIPEINPEYRPSMKSVDAD
ncbi:MAG: sulfatase-like hydrolase/transferase [Akkermansiaceae bacterium]|nr:sulfatase-like hydrolase/transferase [Akkermansiaceae bacterium]